MGWVVVWVVLVAVFVGFAYQFYRIGQRLNWVAFGRALLRPGNGWHLLTALFLMPVNWWLEARKWHLLLREFLPWGFGRTWRTVLAGVSLSSVTPNRIGEIGGRVMVARREEWAGVVTSSLLGSVCQWIAFLLLAWPGLMWTAGGLLHDRLPFAVHWLWPVGPLVLVIGYFVGKPALLRLLDWAKQRWGGVSEDLLIGLRRVKFGLIARAGSYACLRFGVYCTQLYLLLWFFGLELPLLKGLAGIAGIYLVQAGLPLPPGINLVTRTELGLLLWQNTPESAVATLAAFTTLFAVNVLLPALPGYFLIVRKMRTDK